MEWLDQLDAQLERSPSFFAGRPVILDLSATHLNEPGIRALLRELQMRSIVVIGMEGADPSVQGLNVPGWPPMLKGGRTAGAIDVPDEPGERPGDGEEPASLLVSQPVRSGQSIVFPRGDVTVIGSVGSGAEVMAGGSIHVYGTLRGRAVAGMAGNPRHASSAAGWKPSCSPSTASIARPRTSRRSCAARRCRHGWTATRCRGRSGVMRPWLID